MARTRTKPAPVRRFVLGCSIALAWYFADESDPCADSGATALPNAMAIMPSLFHLELANTLVVGERRKRSTEAQATKFLARMSAMPIIVDDQTALRAWSDTIALARRHSLSAYDAAYLELAVRESLPLATLDDPLKVAAATIGVPMFKP